VMATSQAKHESSTGTLPPPKEGSIRAQQDAAIAGSQQSGAKPEPVRNKGPRTGRNDPCPCGSGKKYKQCCMKKDMA
jgi:preprotein translocase subunit SecA